MLMFYLLYVTMYDREIITSWVAPSHNIQGFYDTERVYITMVKFVLNGSSIPSYSGLAASLVRPFIASNSLPCGAELQVYHTNPSST